MAKRHAFNSLEFHDEAHKENLTELKSLLSETELNVNGMNVRMGDTFGCAAIPDQSEKAKNEIKEAIKIAEDLGARALHIMSGVTEYNQTSHTHILSHLFLQRSNRPQRLHSVVPLTLLSNPLSRGLWRDLLTP